VLADRGLDLGQYRRAYLERRLAARLRALDLSTYREYSDVLAENPAEYENLLATLTINVTDFFRDKPVWDILRERVLPDLIADKMRSKSRTIRVWSAGCASGEEPYSLAMAILAALGTDRDKFLITILATDLDENIIKTAALGRYETAKLRHIPEAFRSKYTHALSDTEFEVVPEVRRLVRFRHSSLFDSSPMKVADLILCRNVFIYLDRARQSRVLETFWGSMARGGYMVLGRSEKMSIEASHRFESVVPRERIYRKPSRA